jgi:hypothetical protein
VGRLRKSPGRKDLLTLEDAASLVGKKPSNISYLVQYKRIQRYDTEGRAVQRAPNGGLRVSKRELLGYVETRENRMRSRLMKLKIGDESIAFLGVPESERTKHVHRLHPYLGKFIPQLVGHFLKECFEEGQTVLDPFMGSGTTLVEASEIGLDSVGIDVSAFNAMISRVKLADYDVAAVEEEVMDIWRRTADYSSKELACEGQGLGPLGTRTSYLERWFAPRSLAEMRYYCSIIPEYEHQELLKVLLSRTARSCRLVHHYDLATPKEPVGGPYACYKHRGKTCHPLTTIIRRLKFYSLDTARRIGEFQRVRKPVSSLVLEGDSRTVDLRRELGSAPGFGRTGIDGVFTSPPYVGQIDYHEQHRYAFEIGPKLGGKGEEARRAYADGMVASLRNVAPCMRPGSPVLVVANDRFSLYPEIFDRAGMRVERRYERPVEDRTERDKSPYSESVFLARVV